MKKRGEKILKSLKKVWRRESLVLVAILALFLSIFSVLSNIPENAALQEHATANDSSSLGVILDNPVNAPYKLATYGLTSLSPSIRLVRAVSFVFYIGACIAIFYALRHWHTLQTSIITTAAFATNSVVLAVGRLGTTLITVMSFFIFSSMLLWQLHSRSNKFVPIIVLVALGSLLYTPGALWFFLLLGIVYFNRFKNLFYNVKKPAIVFGIITAILLIAPLVFSFARNLDTLNQWLLIPNNLELSEIPRSILRVPSAFIYRMPSEPLINVGRLPIFDVASGILFLIGLNAYRRKLKLDRTKVMIGSALVAIVIGALGELTLSVILLLPFAYSVIAAGIEYLLDEWYSVFPRNPYARSFGLLLITSVVLFSIYYQMTRFFVVWPQTPETRAVYNQSRIIYEPPTTDTIELEKGE
ncbi:hypothetical protein KBB49_04170 [Candidatus Saccharibacteria bacterium]|nr:hypothetical protein [Candidatus Saccharibacteria bacterium]